MPILTFWGVRTAKPRRRGRGIEGKMLPFCPSMEGDMSVDECPDEILRRRSREGAKGPVSREQCDG